MGSAKASPESESTKVARHRVTSLATALKQTTIYPATHPRVVGSVEGFLRQLTPGGDNYVLLLKERTFYSDTDQVPADQVATAWLADRFRENGMRGVDIASDCSVDEILQFAAFLNRARRQADGAPMGEWSTLRLRALPLVFAGHHTADTSVPNAAPSVTSDSSTPMPPQVRAALHEIRQSESFRAQMLAIDRAAAVTGDDMQRELDLLTTIGKVLPAEVANDPEQIPALVQRILATLQGELQALATGNRKVRGGRLLLRAVELARSFFASTPAAKPSGKVLPTGRPEDERYVAALDALLDEHAALPTDDRPLADLIVSAVGPRLGHEVLGVCLHLLAKARNHEDPVPKLPQLLQQHAIEVPELVDAYVGARGRAALPAPRRLRLVGHLAEAGHAQLVRDRGWLDQDLAAAGFPESLPVIVKVFGDDPAGWQMLRQTLATLARTLSVGGIETARRAGVLADPAVQRALLATGGSEAHALMLAAADGNPRAARALLVDHLRRQKLPEPAALVLKIHDDIEGLPATWVRNLFAAFVHQRYDQTIRRATGELLRAAVVRARPLAAADRVAAIGHLHLVPDAETEQVLTSLAKKGRFRIWDRAGQAVRQQAAKTLAELRTQSRR